MYFRKTQNTSSSNATSYIISVTVEPPTHTHTVLPPNSLKYGMISGIFMGKTHCYAGSDD